MNIEQDARQLSSGTIATLTGERLYAHIDGWRDDFTIYVRTFQGQRRWGSWIDAWNEFAALPQVAQHLPVNRAA